MSVITAEPRTEAEVVQQPRGKARFWDREAPLAYIFMIPGLLSCSSSWPTRFSSASISP